MTDTLYFPANFQWGAATAAFQIEGAVHEDGRSDSIWDVFAHTPGRIIDGSNADTACDHYHRWKEDIALLKQLGIKAYRFSLAWPRILPAGRGKINQPGLDFYSRLVDELLAAGIRPLATLYHWDVPTALPDAWLNRDTVDAFVELTAAATSTLGDRVKDWVTINEPFCPSILSYKVGIHAPGLRDPYKALRAAHHLLLGHGAAMPVIRQNCPGARAGIALNLSPIHPASDSEADRAAARHADGELNRWFLDPLHGRGYPADMLADYVKMEGLPSTHPDFIEPGDLDVISVPTDFLAINYYTRSVVKAGAHFAENPDDILPVAPVNNHDDMNWECYPAGLYEILTRMASEYQPHEIIISENGASFSDTPDASGAINDERRIAYLEGHFTAMAQAIQAGVPLTGYYLWSLMDNFEWALGYTQHFGIVHVEFATQKRTPKASAYWYRQVINNNGLAVRA